MPLFNPMDDSVANSGIPTGILEYFPGLMQNSRITKLAELLTQNRWPQGGTETLSFTKLESILPPAGFLAAHRSVQFLIEELRSRAYTDSVFSPADISIRYFQQGHDFTSWNKGTGGLLSDCPTAIVLITGAERVLNIRNKIDPSIQFSLKLRSNSLLLTKPALIRDWQIRVPRMSHVTSPMIWLMMSRESGIQG